MPDEMSERRKRLIPLIVGAVFVVAVLWPTPAYRRAVPNEIAKEIVDRKISSEE